MGRLFDSSRLVSQGESQRAARARVRERAAEADELLRELEEDDEASRALGDRLAKAQVVAPIVYAEYRKPGGRWLIEHACVGDDYVYQLFPVKPPKIVWQDVLVLAIAAMDVIFPSTVDIQYTPPSEQFQVQFYTIRAKGVVGRPGWKDACIERALPSLASIEAWG